MEKATQKVARGLVLLLAVVLCGCAQLRDAHNGLSGTPVAPSATLESHSNAHHDRTSLSVTSRTDGHAAYSNENIDSAVTGFTHDQLTTTCGSLTGPDYQNFMKCRKIEIDELCVSFFDGLDKAATGAQLGNQELDIVADATSTIMGLTRTPARQLAILAGTKLAVDNSLTAAKAALLLSPPPHTIYRLVYTAQKQTFDGRKRNEDFEAAVTLMRDYAYTCTIPGIREVIDKAVQSPPPQP